jgi:hypothetical protein
MGVVWRGDGQASAAVRLAIERRSTWKGRERRLDDQLALGSRNEHGRRDPDLETAKLASSDEYGSRAARRAWAPQRSANP